MNRLLIFSSLCIFFYQILFADVGQWRTYTNAKDIRQIAVDEEAVWCATNGGLVAYDLVEHSSTKYTNTEGLLSNDLVAIEIDRYNRVWIASSEGHLMCLEPESGEFKIKNDFVGFVIRDLYAYGDSIFVALNIGTSLYDISKWEVKETWKIGECNRVVVDAKEQIWAACNDGVKTASLDFPNLMAPSAWITYTSTDGLPSNNALFIYPTDSSYIIGTERGVVRFDGTNWSDPEFTNFSVVDAVAGEQGLYLATSDGLYHTESGGLWRRLGEYLPNITDILVDQEETVWLGVGQRGLAYVEKSTEQFLYLEPDEPISNQFQDMAFDKRGHLWAVSPGVAGGGISRFDGSTWLTFSKTNGKLNSNNYQAIAVDSSNRVWAASWGAGVAIFDQSGDEITISFLDEADGHLSGISGSSSYIVTTDVMVDKSGNVWILNAQAANQNVLAMVTPDNQWQYFSTVEGIRSLFVQTLEIDTYGRKWVGTQDRGISVVDDNGTPMDKFDDDLSQGLNTNDGLFDLNVRSIAEDDDGVLWIGTQDGLNYWFGGQVGKRYSVINDDINCIAIDALNNKWIGTKGGLSRLDADEFTWEHFSTSNSPLVNDNVTCFAFNKQTGHVYIGTTNGMSVYESPFAQPAQSLAQLKGYPNPFVLDNEMNRFYIENLARDSEIRIFTLAGSLVRKISSEQILGARAYWDGRNDKGDMVSSGVYFYLVTTADGESKAGKVAVIHP